MSKKILLIEDFPVMHDLYGEYLQDRGYRVDVAVDGEDALDKVADEVYDFVFVDLLLPKVNGIEFLENFTERPKQTRVFILSDFNEPEAMQRAKELGVERYLIKAENTPSQLLERLRAYEADEEKQEQE